MITLLGSSDRYCDGLSRRSFLQIGGLALGGLTLPTLLRCEAANAKPRAHKSVIMVYLSGGLAHQDTFDLKPNAPAEVRGEFKPIATNVPGIQICEHLPKLGPLHGQDGRCSAPSSAWRDEHISWQNMTGVRHEHRQARRQAAYRDPSSPRVQGPVDPVVPPFVDLFPTMQHKPYNSPRPGNLGRSAAAASRSMAKKSP